MLQINEILEQIDNHNLDDTLYELDDCKELLKCQLPILDKLEQEIICIPCGWWISEKDREYS